MVYVELVRCKGMKKGGCALSREKEKVVGYDSSQSLHRSFIGGRSTRELSGSLLIGAAAIPSLVEKVFPSALRDKSAPISAQNTGIPHCKIHAEYRIHGSADTKLLVKHFGDLVVINE